ncbi:MAG: lytic transglycosylase domain-containing protein [Alphaproteobacteria bacterium]|nr:MAG: lytic transglycosylase domain-containing protein [Alphaproteobacteria bacterium]TAF77410.1 MAG: lytic transglycosylase domain-containing protein [Alphaproteobacteria bacterium]
MYKFIVGIMAVSLWCATPAHASQEDVQRALRQGSWDKAYALAQDNNGDRFTKSLATWYYLRFSSIVAPFSTYEQFLQQHPDFPNRSEMHGRMEIAFLNSDPSLQEKQQWFKKYPPQSSRAKALAADARGRLSGKEFALWWTEGDFSVSEERYLLQKYRNQFTVTMHIERTNRLLWEEMGAAAERIIPLLPSDQQKLAYARIKLFRRSGNTDSVIASIPANLQMHPAIIYERIRYRARSDNYAGVEELLLRAPSNLPYAHLWWSYQNRVVRDAIEQRRYAVAKNILDKHSQTRTLERVEAEWMRGWLYFAFFKNYAPAAGAFEQIYHNASLPISRSRGAYWAGRAYEAAGNSPKARTWYKLASLYPTTFYGQLAHQHLYPKTPLPLPDFMPPREQEIQNFVRNNPLAGQFQAYARANAADLLWPLIAAEIQKSHDPHYIAHFSTLARMMKEYPLSIKIANEAMIRGIYLAELYPVFPMPEGIAIEPAFALAIARQESRFDAEATSSANAKGLMQLLPSTASRVAQQHGQSYHEGRLFDPIYNIKLGSYYMHGLLNRFDGAKILAICGYNAGPGRPSGWQDRFGTLSTTSFTNTIQWMEMIPFGETRNYVQRVLENYHVYKHILRTGIRTPLRAEETLIQRD